MGVVRAIACIAFYTLSALTNVMVLGAFTESWLDSFGWSRLELSQMYSCAMGLVAVTVVFAGIVFEKLGFRKSCFWSNLALGLSLMGISGLVGDHKFIFVALLFIMQWLGQGFLLVACRSQLISCVKAKGLWAGVQESLGTITVSLLPFLVLHCIRLFGWRSVMCVEGTCFIIAALMSLRAVEAQAPAVEKWDGAPWFLLKDGRFWCINLIVNLPILLSSGFFVHLEAFCQTGSIGLASLQILWIPQMFCIVGAHILWGLLSSLRTWRLRTLLIFIVSTQIAWLMGLVSLSSIFGKLLYVLGSGLGWGCFGVWINIIWERTFGSRYNSFCLSWAVFMGLLFNALGPLIFNFAI